MAATRFFRYYTVRYNEWICKYCECSLDVSDEHCTHCGAITPWHLRKLNEMYGNYF